MKLIQIKLSGFKSFATNTIVEVKGQLVGVVGPNGCGKSNIIDAIRWVLGESSSRQLRAQLMEDVIFDGAANRSAVSRSTVELVFDNTQKILSSLWNTYDQIAIRRLLSRSGDSQYYINNQVVRRRDITDMFLGTGIGARGYAAIEQGMISRIIEARPEELYSYLEESSGVSKYRDRRKEAITSMGESKGNLDRLNDLQIELSKQIESLNCQAEEATKYQELQQDIKRLQAILTSSKIKQLEQLVDEANDNKGKLVKQLERIVWLIEDEEKKLDSCINKRNSVENQVNCLTANFNNLRTDLVRLEEREHHNNMLAKRINDEMPLLLGKIRDLSTAAHHLQSESVTLEEQLAAITNLLNDLKLERQSQLTNHNLLYAKHTQISDEAKKADRDRGKALQELSLLKNTLLHKQAKVTSLQSRLDRLHQEQRILQPNQDYLLLKDDIDAACTILSQLTISLEQDKNILQEYDAHKAKLQLDFNDIKAKISVNKLQIVNLNALVTKVQLSSDVTQVIGVSPSYLWQQLIVKPGYEVVLQIALNDILSAIIVSDFGDIRHMPKEKLTLWLKKTKNKRLLPMDNSLAKMVEITSGEFDAIYALLNDYIVCDNFNSGLALLPQLQGSCKIITKDGHLLTENFITLNANITHNHILEYQSQLQILQSDDVKLHNRHVQLEALLVDISNKYDALNNKYNKDQQLVKITQQQHHQLQLKFVAQEQTFLQLQNNKTKINKEILNLEDEYAALIQELGVLQQSIDKQILIADKSNSQVERLNLAKLDIDKVFDQSQVTMTMNDNVINEHNIRIQLLQQNLSNIRQSIADKHQQIIFEQKRMSKLEQEKLELEKIKSPQLVEDIQLQLNTLIKEITASKVLLDKDNQDIVKLQETLNKNRNIKDKILGEINKETLKQQEQSLLLQNNREILCKLGLSSNILQTIVEDNKYNLNQLQQKIALRQKQIDDIGSVNLKAINDLDMCTAKHRQLLTQIDDLVSAVRVLEGVIMKIDNETQARLEKTFKQVNDCFDAYFKVLFGGGTACLRLTTSNILQSGLQIMATPPGKKNSSIHLLSGGEKALTAMSLVFALFNLNPAPFCLLDEVDAALDDANTLRFCKLVKELSANTQFIYISHNRLTMEIAQQLIGVTMQEKGISTIVSLSLQDAIQYAS